MCGLGVVVCFVKSAQGFTLLTHLQKFCSTKVNVSKERKGAKYCNACCQ